jgi:hypothetical protein
MLSTIKIETDLLSLTEILNQTGNPTVAALILAGDYVEPEVHRVNKLSTPEKDKEREEYIFISYDKWKDEVSWKSEKRWTSEMKRENWNRLDSIESVLLPQVEEMIEIL